MSEIKTNRELAQEISARIGNSPIPFDSVYSICLEIYNELGGEPAEFDSVYSILLETLPLAESIAKKTSITEVDELPDAQDNNNIYRLSSDDKVYMSKLMSREYTNRLPDEQQIDKAYIYNDEDIYYYKGTWTIKLETTQEDEVNGYGWLEYNNDNEWFLYVTQDDAEHATGDTKMFYFYADAVDGVDFENHTVTYDETPEYMNWEVADTITSDGGNVIPAIYNAPEADCIGNAYLVDTEMLATWVYDGTEVQYEDDDTGEQCIGYKWVPDSALDDFKYAVTSKKASEIYYFKGTGWAHSDTIIRVVSTSDVGIWADYEDLYIPQLNAPDSEQIGKAYYIHSLDENIYYKGEYIVQCTDGNSITTYLWTNDLSEDNLSKSYISKEPASAVYNSASTIDLVCLDDLYYLTSVNPVFEYDGWINEFNSDWESNKASSNVNIVKYQRVIENWEWKQIPTMDDIPQTIEYHAGQNISIDASNNISAEGYVFNANGDGEIAFYYFNEDEEEMMLNTASGAGAHAEGSNTTATGTGAHAEGQSTIASGSGSHAEGLNTKPSGEAAHAEGVSTTAQNYTEHAEGRNNISHKANATYGNAGNTQHSIGIGTGNNNKKNAFEVMQNGDAYVFGIGGYQGTDTKVQNASIMTVQDYVSARETYIDTNFAKVVSLTQQQYDALATKDAHTLYIITDAQ